MPIYNHSTGFRKGEIKRQDLIVTEEVSKLEIKKKKISNYEKTHYLKNREKELRNVKKYRETAKGKQIEKNRRMKRNKIYVKSGYHKIRLFLRRRNIRTPLNFRCTNYKYWWTLAHP